MTECRQCGQCCRHIIIPFQRGAEVDKELCAYRGIIIKNQYLIIPCRCDYLFKIPGSQKYLCDLYGSRRFPKACTDQKADGWQCKLLHEVLK